MKNEKLIPLDEDGLFSDVKAIIVEARYATVKVVNSNLVLMNWHIGDLTNRFILEGERAAYGQKIIVRLSQKLTYEFGRGYSRANIFNCLRFAETFPDYDIVYALSRQLSWTHFRSLIYIDDPLKKD